MAQSSDVDVYKMLLLEETERMRHILDACPGFYQMQNIVAYTYKLGMDK